MSKKTPPIDLAPNPSGSGQHPSVQAYRERLESFDERTMPMLTGVNDRLAHAMADATQSAAPALESGWTITIRGRGPHHNAADTDANRIAHGVVRVLLAAGHRVDEAVFANGAEESVIDSIDPTPKDPSDEQKP